MCHNQRFVNAEMFETYVDRLKTVVKIKVHTNTIEGNWGNLKPKLKIKRGVGERLEGWAHFYSFK